MGQGYAQGTSLPSRTTKRVNPARVGEGKPVADNLPSRLGVARKPAKNKAAK